MFKIQNVNTGLFSGANSDPRFSKNGKTWSSKTALALHIAVRRSYKTSKLRLENDLNNLVVVEYEMVEKSRTPMRKYIEDLDARRK